MTPARFLPSLPALRRILTATSVLAMATASGSSWADPPQLADGAGGPATLAPPVTSASDPVARAQADLATGTASTQYPFTLETARGDAQPTLSLQYNSANGLGFAGEGWTLNLPSIVRKGAAGLPRFEDVANDTHDDFYVDGKLLVPICLLSSPFGGGAPFCDAPSSATLQPGEVFPAAFGATSTDSWGYFRKEIDDGSRYFLQPDGQAWVVQTKSGHLLTFGEPLDANTLFGDGREYPDAVTAGTLGAPSQSPAAVYRWNLVRDSDASGNTVYYSWSLLPDVTGSNGTTAGTLFLRDIFDTPSVSSPSTYAHHVHLGWSLQEQVGTIFSTQGPQYSTSPIWKAPPFALLKTVDVTSATWGSTQRQLVRRYSLAYTLNGSATRSYLTSISMTGTCSPDPTEDGSGLLPAALPSACSATLPATTMSYYGISGASTAPIAVLKTNTYGQLACTPGSRPPSGVVTHGGVTLERDTGVSWSCGGTHLVDVNGDAIADFASTSHYSDEQLCDIRNDQNSNIFCYSQTDLPAHDAVLVTTFPGASQTTISLAPPASGFATSGFDNAIFGPWGPQAQIGMLWPYAQNGPSFAYPNMSTPGLTSIQSGPGHDVDLTLGAANPFTLDGTNSSVLDFDGDGLPDVTLGSETSTTGNPVYLAAVTAQSIAGAVRPYAYMAPAVPGDCSPDDYRLGQPGLLGLSGIDSSKMVRAVADIDGDGVSDLIVAAKGPSVSGGGGSTHLRMYVLPGRGDGRFGSGRGSDALGRNGQGTCWSSFGVPIVPGAGQSGDQSDAAGTDPLGQGTVLRFGDLNGDGLADYALADSSGVSVCLRTNSGWDDAHWRCKAIGASSVPKGSNHGLLMGDLDGSGVQQVLYYDADAGSATAFQMSPNGSNGGTRDGLLKTIANGRGATTTFNYTTVTQLPAFTHTKVLPVPAWVVTQVTTSNNLANSVLNVTNVRQYKFDDPIYDPRERIFAGFQVVTETQPGSGATPTVVTQTLFGTAVCSDDFGCGNLVDYSTAHAVRGLPLEKVVGTSVSTSDQQRTDWTEYKAQFLYTNAEGRKVVQITPYQEHTYLADPSTQATVAARAAFNGGLVSLPVITQPQELLRQHNYDGFGNETSTVDFGSRKGSADQPILVARTWALPAGDQTGWNYRLKSISTSYADATGTTTIGPLRLFASTYDAKGRLTAQYGLLSGTAPLQRSNPGGTTAATPQDASAQGSGTLALLRSITYEDGTGNVLSVQTPNSRCTSTTYDPLFDQLPASTSVYPGGCGTQAQTTALQYDRGFEKVTQSQAPNGALTLATYDPFGRVTEVDEPSPSALGATVIKMCATYGDLSPASYVHLRTAHGDIPGGSCTILGTAGYADHYTYTDGFGDPIGRIDNATNPTNPADLTFYVASGVHVRDSLGRVTANFQPTYVDAPLGFYPNLFDWSQTPKRTSTYDALGRLTGSTDFKGSASMATYRPATLSADLFDAEQNSAQTGATHANGSKTTILMDGHGRTVTTSRYLGASTKLDTTTTYLATGEPTSIVQGSVTRTMQYDTLGRMVSNTEPNSGTWVYAYNDNGDLVGTSDARGCGKNIYHDGLGRVTGEDYSPCQGSVPSAYSSPNSSIGGTPAQTGMETLRVYDNAVSGTMRASVGKLIDIYDRAEHENFTYDGLGRVAQIQRNIASPDGQTYTPNPFKKSFTYTLADQTETSSTGADSSSLLNPSGLPVAPGSNVVASYTMQGTIQAVVSSYGVLLASQTVDATGAPTHQLFGDAALTTADIGYDANKRVSDYALHRGSGPWAVTLGGAVGTCSSATGFFSCSQPTLQTVLTHLRFSRDFVGNPTAIFETAAAINGASVPGVNPSEWPAGALPVSHVTAYSGGKPGPGYVYGDDYRLKEADSIYGGPDITTGAGTDTFKSPYTTAERTSNTLQSYPLLQPVTGNLRVKKQAFVYDLRGNATSSTDDANDFFDRSLGAVTYAGGSDRLTNATGTNQSGSLSGVSYDNTGDLTSLTVLSSGTATYSYGWDEVGRLSSAQVTAGTNTISEHFAYDAGGRRVLIARHDPVSQTDQYTVNVFDSLVLKGAAFGASAQPQDYAHTDATEHVYLAAGGLTLGHAFVDQGTTLLPRTNILSAVHTYMEFDDPTRSTSFVVDHDTGELVERMTYQAYGATESDYRPARWNNFREDRRYSGHDDDSEVGLVYFGARYYSPQLQRWLSPDPIAIHGLSGDLNPYAYAYNSPIRFYDPIGLLGQEGAPGDTQCVLFICGGGGGGGGGGGVNINIDLGNLFGTKPSSSPHGPPGAPPGTSNAAYQGPMGGFSSAGYKGGYTTAGGSYATHEYEDLQEDYEATSAPLWIAGAVIGSLATSGELVAGGLNLAEGGLNLAAKAWASIGGTSDLLADVTIVRTAGGALSGGVGAATQGKDASGIAQAALVSGAIALWNPGALLGGGVIGGGVNTAAGMIQNQLLTMSERGQGLQTFNGSAVAVGVGTRLLFGWAASGPGTELMTPSTTLWYQLGSGFSSGLAGGAMAPSVSH